MQNKVSFNKQRLFKVSMKFKPPKSLNILTGPSISLLCHKSNKQRVKQDVSKMNLKKFKIMLLLIVQMRLLLIVQRVLLMLKVQVNLLLMLLLLK